MQPLVLLLLLSFFLLVAFAFTVWSALRVGDAARRSPGPPARPSREPAPREISRKVATSAAEPAAAGAKRAAAAEPQPRATRGERRRAKPVSETPPHVTVARNNLWERSEPSVVVPAPEEEQRGARVVVTPRKRSDDAFERFLESEKRRD